MGIVLSKHLALAVAQMPHATINMWWLTVVLGVDKWGLGRTSRFCNRKEIEYSIHSKWLYIWPMCNSKGRNCFDHMHSGSPPPFQTCLRPCSTRAFKYNDSYGWKKRAAFKTMFFQACAMEGKPSFLVHPRSDIHIHSASTQVIL